MRPTDLAADDRAWDAFVAGAPYGSFPQLTAWAEANASGGWRVERVVAPGPGGPVGIQLLLHRPRWGPWSRAYGHRGPVAAELSSGAIAALTGALRAAGRGLRLSRVLIDPELPLGHPLEDGLRRAGWRRVPSFEINVTRIVDVSRPEPELWSALRPKWRQYVHKAAREGVVIADAGAGGLDAFVPIHEATARRVGFRAARVRAVYAAFDRRGAAGLLLAQRPLAGGDGAPESHAAAGSQPGSETLAGLLLVRCGDRTVELYGGMTEAGAALHANYLLKWEAMRRAAAGGFRRYDMWGTDAPGLAQFKRGFGGQETTYTGGWELIIEPLGAALEQVVGRAASAVRRASPPDGR
ncbi:MAG TPA: peptidoglycan bridge formation glycyltransferase FemA/FemB family protein [Candidatus Limnocylindrales bacterium]|nr:peptidoglycan bridge formation glycyltransferase FemA/FemB family protein [Candidatus Limnocylindrales bacterium]